jgi:hypothetical protein
MLCPGCVAESLPQLRRIHELFPADAVTAIALHSVFEHHAAMTPVSLEAFIHEYRLTFPIGVDQQVEGSPIPQTMQRYGMKGTPTSILIGRDGQIRHHGFGQEDDMAIGMIIGSLLAEKAVAIPAGTAQNGGACADGVCKPQTDI